MSPIGLKSIPSCAKRAPGAPRQRPEDRRRSDSEAQPLWSASHAASACLRSEGFAEDLPEWVPQTFMPPRRSGARASLISLMLLGTALLPGR